MVHICNIISSDIRFWLPLSHQPSNSSEYISISCSILPTALTHTPFGSGNFCVFHCKVSNMWGKINWNWTKPHHTEPKGKLHTSQEHSLHFLLHLLTIWFLAFVNLHSKWNWNYCNIEYFSVENQVDWVFKATAILTADTTDDDWYIIVSTNQETKKNRKNKKPCEHLFAIQIYRRISFTVFQLNVDIFPPISVRFFSRLVGRWRWSGNYHNAFFC